MSAYHLIGIGGAGMSVVAELLHGRGHLVSGSDQSESPILDHLRSVGVTAHSGHNADNVPADATVVISSAVRESNVELSVARSRNQEILHRSQALALAAEGLRFVAVAGAHGKTTTSGMLAVALTEAGADPSFAVGSIVPPFGSGARLGGGDIFIAEADESDESFLNYSPAIALVTNIEPDHLDHYASREAFEEVFARFAQRIIPGGHLVACAEDDSAMRLADYARSQGIAVHTYGRPEHSLTSPDLAIHECELLPDGARARLGGLETESDLRLKVPGIHNILNAAGAYLVGHLLGVEAAAMTEGLAHFGGTARRFDFKGEVAGRRLYDDYAHHPTEVAAAIAQARVVANGGEVTVVFQPHLYSRTQSFADRFAQALSGADHIVLADIYGAREDPIDGVDSSLISSQIPGAHFIGEMHEATRYGAALTPHGGILITMGAGSITQCADDALTQWQSEKGS